MNDLIERLRVTRLLSQRNQMALQCEAADALEAAEVRITQLEDHLRGIETRWLASNSSEDDPYDQGWDSCLAQEAHLAKAVLKDAGR